MQLLWEGAMKDKPTLSLRWYKNKPNGRTQEERFFRMGAGEGNCSLRPEWIPWRLMVTTTIGQGGASFAGAVKGELESLLACVLVCAN